jgi:tRNA nucleotidyltransferase/poly(A) polymerase
VPSQYRHNGVERGITLEKELVLVKKVARSVEKIGGTMYFVGGFVRDRKIGKDSKDIDVEIHGITEEQLVEVLSQFGNVDKIGASFGVYLIKGVDIDFALPRVERQTGVLHTDFDVTVNPFIGTYEASKRRDFTMNALMENVLTGELIDHFGGMEDIENGIIRMVDEETFKEDALRVLRAIQFSARFVYSIDEKTRQVAEQMELHHLAKERVYEEIRKGMTKGSPDYFISMLNTFRNVKSLLPSLPHMMNIRVQPGLSLPINVALMGTTASNFVFEQVLVDFLQRKQDRSTARACHSFFLDIWMKGLSEKDMAETIFDNKAFLSAHPEDADFIVKTFFTLDKSTVFYEMMEKRTNCHILIDGNWLIQRGLKPSNTFRESLRQAEVMAWLGSSEQEIKEAVIGIPTL